MVAGHVVVLGADGKLQNFEVTGYIVVGTALVAYGLVRQLMRGSAAVAPPDSHPAVTTVP